jgi:transposase
LAARNRETDKKKQSTAPQVNPTCVAPQILFRIYCSGHPPFVIPPRSNRKNPRVYDQELYKARHLIENFFARLKQFRAIATRYDKTARNFLAAIYLVASVIWLN